MRRLLNKYRWELWLFIGIPVGAALFASTIGLIYTLGAVAWGGYPGSWGWTAFIGDIVAAVLLGALYPRIRNLERPMLTVFWKYTLVALVVSAAASLATDQLGIFDGWVGSIAARAALLNLTMFAVGGLVQLWFARQASRFSLAHAFLLIALNSGIGSPLLVMLAALPVLFLFFRRFPEFGWQDLAAVIAATVASMLLSIAVSLFAIWALAHFDTLGRKARTRSVLALFLLRWLYDAALIGFQSSAVWQDNYGAIATTTALLTLSNVVFTLIMLGLTYLVRVRQPTGPPPSVPSPT